MRCAGVIAIALWMAVIGEACATSPSPVSPSSTVSANEPRGMTVVTDWAMDQPVPAGGDVAIAGSQGWRVVYEMTPGRANGWVEQSIDPSAPRSPSSVYDFVFPEGMVEGHAPATVYYRLAAREVYAAFWWKPSVPFDVGPNGNKIAFLFNGGGAEGGQQFLILRRDGLLHVLPEYRGDFQWRSPNVSATPVTLGAWHLIEWHVQLSTGTLKWWLDGSLQGHHTDVRNDVAFDMFQISPTFGGNTGARKRQTDHYYFDHLRLSIGLP